MQKKKVLILGATGMLGHIVHNVFDKLEIFDLYNSVFRQPLNEKSIICDVENQNSLISLFTKVRPDVVINCIGALVQKSESNPSSAIYLNALLPHILKNLCNSNDAKLIHVSTDCVFSGLKGSYSEKDFRDEDNLYGRSKALGEILEPPHCTLRTSIIGPELKDGTGLFHWFGKQDSVVRGYTEAFWSGVTTVQLAKAMIDCIEYDLKGLYHVTNGEKISKFQLLNILNAYSKKPIEIIPFHDYKSDKSLLKSKKFDFNIPSYESMIKELFSDEYLSS